MCLISIMNDNINQIRCSSVSQEPAIDALRQVRDFLENNKNEIVTIIIEDYVTTPNGIGSLFDRAGLRNFWFPVSEMPKNGGDWPTVDSMIRKNQRLLVFTSKANKEATEGIAYQWAYMVENQCKTIYFGFESIVHNTL